MNIIGKSECTASQMAQYLISKNPNAKPWALEYAQLYLEEGETEGVRGDGAWYQSCKETGNFKFNSGTAVTFDQNNFCGLGVTRKGMKGHSFDTPRLGIRAQIQHLKGYATTAPLKNPCIDPRYKYITKGCAPRFEDLAGKWAVPGYNTNLATSLEDAMNKGIGYGFDIIAGINTMKKLPVTNEDLAVNTAPGTNTSPTNANYYRVQCGAYSKKENATALEKRLQLAGFNTYVKQIDNLYKVQLGAYSNKKNAEEMLNKVKSKGFNAFIVYDGDSKKETISNNAVASTNKKYKVAIDAGHGSTTAGKRTPDGYKEHWINVKTAYYCEQYLKKHNIDTVRIGWDDTDATDDIDVGLTARQNQIKSENCDVAASLHANAYGSGYNDKNGVETFIHSNSSYQKDSLSLANKVQARIIQGTKQTNRGVKKQVLAMCNCVAMNVKAACLVEVGFMTNQHEAGLMKTDEFCKEQGEDVAKGILDYLEINIIHTFSTPVASFVTGDSCNDSSSSIESNIMPPHENSIIKAGQVHANNFAQCGLLADGIYGTKTQKAGVKVLQRALNLDYKAGLVEDGIYGNKTAQALGTHSVKQGQTQYMVTALEILLMLKGYDCNGLELPGVYDNNLENCVKEYQKDNKLAQTGYANASLFKLLVS